MKWNGFIFHLCLWLLLVKYPGSDQEPLEQVAVLINQCKHGQGVDDIVNIRASRSRGRLASSKSIKIREPIKKFYKGNLVLHFLKGTISTSFFVILLCTVSPNKPFQIYIFLAFYFNFFC